MDSEREEIGAYVQFRAFAYGEGNDEIIGRLLRLAELLRGTAARVSVLIKKRCRVDVKQKTIDLSSERLTDKNKKGPTRAGLFYGNDRSRRTPRATECRRKSSTRVAHEQHTSHHRAFRARVRIVRACVTR